MASNIYNSLTPSVWSSAYDDIQFEFSFKTYSIVSANSTSPYGWAELTVYPNFDVTPVVNDNIYISVGIYAGYHKVISATSSSVTIDVLYSGNQTIGNIEHLRVPLFTLYKGFRAFESFPNELPYTSVNSFIPLYNGDRKIKINLRGLLQTIFSIGEPPITSSFAFSTFNAYRLAFDTELTNIRYVLNAGIDSTELYESYINGNYMNEFKPLKFGCGITFATKFKDGFPIMELFTSGNQVQQGFSTAFSSAFDSGTYNPE